MTAPTPPYKPSDSLKIGAMFDFIPPVATNVTVASSDCKSSVTLVHPAKSVGRNEMPVDRDTCEVPSNTVLGRGAPVPHEKGRFGGRNPQYAAVPPIWSLFEFLTVADLEISDRTITPKGIYHSKG